MFENQEKLNQTIQFINNDFPLDAKWQREGVYAFKCSIERGESYVYQLDLYRGCIYLNGK